MIEPLAAAWPVVGCIGIAFLCSQIAKRIGFPPVLSMLLVGMLTNAVFSGASLSSYRCRGLSDAALAAVGLQIGSHLNADILMPLRWELAKFLSVFTLIIVTFVAGATAVLFPSHAVYAPLVGAIAIERSSPEALAGIVDARASGTFTRATMCIAAAQDVLALVLFVFFSAVLTEGENSGIPALASSLVVTAISVVGVLALHYWLEQCRVQQEVTFSLIAIVISAFHRHGESELLLSAVIAGAILNWKGLTPMLLCIEAYSDVINCTLFAVIGMRISIAHFVTDIAAVALLFTVRLAALMVGGFVGSTVAGLPHRKLRGLAHVTQLAIALSLVHRMEAQFPLSEVVSRSTGGSVVLSLFSGPACLQFALRKSGDVPTR